jgi:hypothetical protein
MIGINITIFHPIVKRFLYASIGLPELVFISIIKTSHPEIVVGLLTGIIQKKWHASVENKKNTKIQTAFCL